MVIDNVGKSSRYVKEKLIEEGKKVLHLNWIKYMKTLKLCIPFDSSISCLNLNQGNNKRFVPRLATRMKGTASNSDNFENKIKCKYQLSSWVNLYFVITV